MPDKQRTYLALGTNLQDRQANIERALQLLETRLGAPPLIVSPILETEAIGFDGPAFLDCIAVFDTYLDPYALLDCCKSVEREMGRSDEPEYAADGSRIYHDRVIDVDILFFGDCRIRDSILSIPHPQVVTRPYIKKLLLLLQDYTPDFLRENQEYRI